VFLESTPSAWKCPIPEATSSARHSRVTISTTVGLRNGFGLASGIQPFLPKRYGQRRRALGGEVLRRMRGSRRLIYGSAVGDALSDLVSELVGIFACGELNGNPREALSSCLDDQTVAVAVDVAKDDPGGVSIDAGHL